MHSHMFVSPIIAYIKNLDAHDNDMIWRPCGLEIGTYVVKI